MYQVTIFHRYHLIIIIYFRVITETEVDDRDEIITNLKKKIEFLEKRQALVGNLLSDEQMKKLEGSKSRIRWSLDDISKAIVIYSAGPRSYRLLLKKGYPFPAVSTLKTWLRKIRIVPGILKNIFNVMKMSEMSNLDKICVLSFDEMKIRKCYLYDKVNDETIKPFSYVQVAILRGLVKSWKQPVFFDFDCKMTKQKLFKIIQFAESSGNAISTVSVEENQDNFGCTSSMTPSVILWKLLVVVL